MLVAQDQLKGSDLKSPMVARMVYLRQIFVIGVGLMETTFLTCTIAGPAGTKAERLSAT